MAVFSVYDYDRRMFDYYEKPGAHQALGTATFSTFRKVKGMPGQTKLGSVPESIALPLPSGVMKTGEGAEPKGVIASRGSPGGGGVMSLGSFGGIQISQPTFLMVVGFSVGMYFILRKKK